MAGAQDTLIRGIELGQLTGAGIRTLRCDVVWVEGEGARYP